MTQIPEPTDESKALAHQLHALCMAHCAPASIEVLQQRVLETLMALAVVTGSVIQGTEEQAGRPLFDKMLDATLKAQRLYALKAAGQG
jgi:hypothetical protein